MKVVYKYPLQRHELQDIALPQGAQILTIQQQGLGHTMLWALVDPSQPAGKRRIRIRLAGTGHQCVPNDAVYLATVQEGQYVWHFFEEPLP